MPKFFRVFALTAMAIGSGAYVKAELAPSFGDIDVKISAQTAELKGDRARIDHDYARAIADYQIALQIDPRNSGIYNKLGIAEIMLNNRGAARKYFNLALKYDSGNASALNNLGTLALMQKNFKQAANYLKRALALDETSPSAHLNLAEAWMGLNQVDRATTEYSRALELNPDILAQDDGGVVAQTRTPEQRARLEFLIAGTYAKRGNLEGALDYLNRAKDDHYPDLHKVYSDQEFASLWTDPRLTKIVKR